MMGSHVFTRPLSAILTSEKVVELVSSSAPTMFNIRFPFSAKEFSAVEVSVNENFLYSLLKCILILQTRTRCDVG